MAEIKIDPLTGSPIVMKVNTIEPEVVNLSLPVIKVPAVVATVKSTPVAQAVAITDVKTVKSNGDSPANRAAILNALKASGGDSMQQQKTYNTILNALGWV